MIPKARSLAVAVVVAIILGALIWAVSSIGAPQAHSQHSALPALRVAYPEPANLNPFTTVDAIARRAVLRYTHDTLLEQDPRGPGLRPALATRMIDDGDGRLRFELRRGVKFSDGTPLRMADVLFTFRAANAPQLPLGALRDATSLVTTVRALDDHTLAVQLRDSTAVAVRRFATGYIVTQERFFSNHASIADIRTPGPGTGPYRIADYRPGDAMRLEQSAHSWRRAEHPDRWQLPGMVLRFVTDPAARFTLFLRDELDLYQHSDLPQILKRRPKLRTTHHERVYDHDGLGHFAIVWNTRRPHLADPRVRRALTMCFDRERICREVFGGRAKMSRSWFRPGSTHDSRPGSELPFDPPTARRLFREAQATAPVELLFAAGQPQQRTMATLGRAVMESAGITLQCKPMEWGALVTRLTAHDFDGILLHMSIGTPADPFREFHSAQIGKGRNWMGYRNPEVDQLLESARSARDAATLHSLYVRLNAILREDQPRTLLAYPLSSVLIHKRFQGAIPSRLGLYPEQWRIER